MGVGAGAAPAGAPLRNGTVREALALAALVAIPAAFYAPGLGFYLDDWGFWAWMRASPDQSLAGLYRTLYQNLNLSVRPGQIVWLIAGYELSPHHAGPIHAANHLLFGAGLLTLYAALRSIPRWRGAAFPVALLYGSAASFTAIRMWWASQQATLAWLFFAATLWLTARAMRSSRSAPYAAAIIVTGVAGGLCYEFFTPFVPLLPAFVWWGWGRDGRGMLADRRFRVLTGAGVVAVTLVMLYKLHIGEGVGALTGGRHRPVGYALDIARMYLDMARDNLWSAGLASPGAALLAAAGPLVEWRAVIATLVAMAVLLAVLRPWRAPAVERSQGTPAPRALTALGLAIFVIGYAALWPNLYYLPGAWGPNNRENHAAALGVAILLFAVFSAIGRRWPRAARCALLVWCLAGVFLQVTVGRAWVRAAGEQRAVLAQVAAVAPQLAPGKVLLLYGLCPYVGPGPVFPYRGWDLRQALHLDGLSDLDADLLTPGTRLDRSGIVVSDPVSHDAVRYRYGSFAVLDHASGALTPIDSGEAAQRYFATRSLALPTRCRYHKGAGAGLY